LNVTPRLAENDFLVLVLLAAPDHLEDRGILVAVELHQRESLGEGGIDAEDLPTAGVDLVTMPLVSIASRPSVMPCTSAFEYRDAMESLFIACSRRNWFSMAWTEATTIPRVWGFACRQSPLISMTPQYSQPDR